MGLAASQARLLVLTARKSDLEYRAQNITNRKLLLSSTTQQIAMDYSDKLNNYVMEFSYDVNENGNNKTLTESLGLSSIYAENPAFVGQYRAKLADGRIAVSSIDQLKFAIAQSKGVAQLTPAQIYANLSDSEKLAYFKEALSAINTQNNAGTLPESVKSLVVDSKVLKADKTIGGVTLPKGTVLSNRRNELTNLLTEVYAKNGISALTYEDDKTKTTKINEFSSKNAILNLSEEQLTAIKNLMGALGSAATKVNADALNYYKANVPAATALPTPSTTDPASTTDNDKYYYMAAIYALNSYIKDNPDTSANAFLDANVVPSTDYDYLNTDIAATDTKSLLDYLNDVSAEAAADPAKDADLFKLMSAFGDNLANIIYSYSSFGSFCKEQVSGTGYSDMIQTGENEYYCQTTGETFIVLPGLENKEFFQNSLRTGAIYLEKRNENSQTGWDTVLVGGSDVIRDRLYTEDDNAAQAEYDSKTAIIQRQDKMLDVELKQIETQQKACDNEIDSVKKILDKNSERSFKIFS